MIAAPSRLGKYDIVRALGEGAMGVVYEAVDSVIERSVAIKTIRRGDLDADEAAEHARRFLIEAKAAGKLNHPNIIGLYDHGNEGGLAYIVMELVHGRELQHWFNEGHAFEPGEALRLMGELLDALGYSHQRGVIHRDVKPANIFITDQGHIKLGDFGIARIESSQKTRIGTAMGTPSHMAPEQIRGEPADARSDLYAAGVVLFQFLTGTRPFAGTMLSMALKVLNEPAPAPSSLRPELPPALDAVMAKALAKRAGDRYQSAAEFWQALAAAGAGGASSGFVASGFGAAWAASGHGPAWSPSGFGVTDTPVRETAPPAPSAPPAPTSNITKATAPTPAPVDVHLPDLEPQPITTPSARHVTEKSATPVPQRGVPRTAWRAMGALALLLLALAGWRLRPAPADSPAPMPRPLPQPAQPASASAPLPGTAPASAPASASASTPAAAPAPAPASAPLPKKATPTQRATTAPAASAATSAGTDRRAAREPARSATPRPPPAATTPPPQPKGPRPARCSDILQKASLEPLTGEEAAYLRRECQ